MTKSNIIQKLLLYIIVVFIIATGCDKTLHETDIIPPDGSKSAVIITLNNEGVDNKPLNDAHIYFFNEKEILTSHNYYPKMTDLALDRVLTGNGSYTVFAILNTEENLSPYTKAEENIINIQDFMLWVSTLDKKYENLLTGALKYEVKNGINNVSINLQKGSEGAEVALVTLNLTFPQPLLPEYIAEKSKADGEQVKLRTIIEVYKRGTGNRILRKSEYAIPTETEGVYTKTITLPKGEYDIRIWGDYTQQENLDYHYNTEDLKNVKILPKESYIANTDTRDGFAYATTINIGKEDIIENITLHRPLAKYKIVANDVEEYEQMREKRGYPPINELIIQISYAGYFPAGYNVTDGTLTASLDGYKFRSWITENDNKNTTIAKDFVLVNGKESSVVVNIMIKDAQDNIISGVKGVNINYKAGHLTTIKGNFLTAGKGGMDIITSWEGEHNVEF